MLQLVYLHFEQPLRLLLCLPFLPFLPLPLPLPPAGDGAAALPLPPLAAGGAAPLPFGALGAPADVAFGSTAPALPRRAPGVE